MFSGNTGSSGTGLFGSGMTGNAGQQPAGNIFGSGSSNPAGNTPSSTGGLFGNTSSTTPGSSLFGANAGSTAAGSGLFGANAGSTGSGLFGGGNTNTSSTPNTTGNGRLGGVFGNPSSGLGGGLFGSQQSTGTTAGASPIGTLNNTPATQNSTSGGLFGTTTPAASTDATKTSTTTNPLFGGSSAFSSSKPPESTVKPPSNFFSLGGTSGTTPAVGTSGLFNLPKPAGTSNTPAATTSGTSGSTSSTMFGGGGLFGNPQASSANTSTTGTSLFSLGGEKKDPQTTSTILGGGLFGAPKSDEPKKDGTQAASQPFSLFSTTSKPDEKKDTSTALSTINTQDVGKKDALALSVAVAPPSMLRGKTLEEIINKWTADLEVNVREFNRFGAEVAVWDRALIENGNNIAALYGHVLAAEKQQNEINESLNHIEQQQRDLASTLDAYEKISQEILGGQGSTLRTLDAGPADNERDKNYMLATDLYTHLDDLSGSLTQMIDSVNALSISSKSEDPSDDPMAQITQILSSHLESLQWIDSAVHEVEGKASEVEKRVNLSGHSLSGSGLKSRGNRT